LRQDVPPTEEYLASIAISLKRLADAECDDILQSRGVRPSIPPPIPWKVTAILDQAHVALRTIDAEVVVIELDKAVVTRPALDRVGNAIAAIEEFAREHGITLTEFRQ
jgi:hypothetical protein